ncbi:MAG: toll/interleukin-1 receptor domain-containing protein [Candidatus Omnitrophica bacterium]|nr:toll/interleukin-1 receptor domain-containing protein [Candidatus Omnitrophota bacterium]MDD5488291.1 toll/interleukin-1 receptor domain-containing protein [Candidatus Omnitrophota bacterium]
MVNSFISYAVEDKEMAEKLHYAMTRAGIETFMAGISIEPGERWTEVIFEKLREAKWVFFLASKISCDSKAVQQELGGALVQQKTIVPLLIDISPEELPGWIDRHQAIDIKQAPEKLHKAIENVAERIKIDKFWAGVVVGALVFLLILYLKES